jgi:hypothetical protein
MVCWQRCSLGCEKSEERVVRGVVGLDYRPVVCKADELVVDEGAGHL